MRFFGILAHILCHNSVPVCFLSIKFGQSNLESLGFRMHSNRPQPLSPSTYSQFKLKKHIFLPPSKTTCEGIFFVHFEISKLWQNIFYENGNSDVRGQIYRKPHVGFPPNLVCKTSKILSSNFQYFFQLVTLYN